MAIIRVDVEEKIAVSDEAEAKKAGVVYVGAWLGMHGLRVKNYVEVRKMLGLIAERIKAMDDLPWGEDGWRDVTIDLEESAGPEEKS